MPQHVIEKNAEHQHLAGLMSSVADLIERVKRLEAARPPPQGRYLSQEDAAVLIGVKPPTLAAWRHFGKGPRYIKVGRQAFYLETDIESWMDAQLSCRSPRRLALNEKGRPDAGAGQVRVIAADELPNQASCGCRPVPWGHGQARRAAREQQRRHRQLFDWRPGR
jgi:hypothetical protein